jgi:methionyl-tRNA formyltransferase
LLAAGHEIALVLTQPDRPAGRGMRPAGSAVKRLAVQAALPVYQPERLDSEAIERVMGARADALVVAAYGLLLPPPLLSAAPHGALNIHASLLPRWRGAAPIQRALLEGDEHTGISIMKMDAGLDTGPIISQQRVAIVADEDAGTLHDKLAGLGAEMIVVCLADIGQGRARERPQPDAGATYARKIEKRDTLLDWSRPAAVLERRVRAFRPAPGAMLQLQDGSCKIWHARVLQASGAAGEVLEADRRLVVACAQGALGITELQRAGGRRLPAAQFLRGHPLTAGLRLP